MLKRYQDDRLAVIDLGTNAIRLNVYEGFVSIYQEKNFTGLGGTLSQNGCLSRRGKAMVWGKLRQYKKILSSLEVSQARILATEAIRSAKDSGQFIQRLENVCDMPLSILSGEEEAAYLAQGVLAAFPEASGLICDCGGGSIELATLQSGVVGDLRSFPYGVMRMRDQLRRMRDPWKYVANMLEENSWIAAQPKGQPLYITGGTWRTLAQVFMYQRQYPLFWVNNYGPNMEDFSACLGDILKINFDTIPLSRIKQQRRLLPTAAILLKGFLDVLQPSGVRFCAFGLREGYLRCLLKVNDYKDSPLVSYARYEARGSERATLKTAPTSLLRAPLGLSEDLLFAAYLLAAMKNKAPENLRGDHAFITVMDLPLVGLTHHEHVWLAYAVGSSFGTVHREGRKWELIDYFLNEKDLNKAGTVADLIRERPSSGLRFLEESRRHKEDKIGDARRVDPSNNVI